MSETDPPARVLREVRATRAMVDEVAERARVRATARIRAALPPRAPAEVDPVGATLPSPRLPEPTRASPEAKREPKREPKREAETIPARSGLRPSTPDSAARVDSADSADGGRYSHVFTRRGQR